MTLRVESLGVRYGAVVRHADARGSFRELWRASAYPSAGIPAELSGVSGSRFVQANLSVSAAGVLRGLHYHRRQLDRWIVATGRAFVALVDVRPAATGDGAAVVETRELGADEWVEIPAGVVGPVVARFDDMKTKFAAMVWDRIFLMDTFDPAQVLTFFQQFGDTTEPEAQVQCTQVSPSRVAVVVMPPASLPAPGSESANEPAAYSPLASFGLYAFFCSSVPNAAITSPTMFVTAMVTAVDAHARATSCIASA